MFMSNPNQREQILIEFYKAQWKVISDLDELDWRVALIFVPLVGALSFVFGIAWEFVSQQVCAYTNAFRAASLVSYLISLYGLWTVAKGQVQTMLKFKTLGSIENDLHLSSYVYGRPEDYRFQRIWPVIICRRFALFMVYSVLGFLSLSMTFIPVNQWRIFENIFSCELLRIASIQIVLVIVILFLHYWDYELHLKREDNWLYRRLRLRAPATESR